MPERQHGAKTLTRWLTAYSAAPTSRAGLKRAANHRRMGRGIIEKAPLPRRLGFRNLRCPLRLDADRASVWQMKMRVANVEAIR